MIWFINIYMTQTPLSEMKIYMEYMPKGFLHPNTSVLRKEAHTKTMQNYVP